MIDPALERLPGHIEADDDSIGDLLERLVDDAEDFVKAEVRLYRAEATHRIAEYRRYLAIAIFGAMFAAAAFFLLLLAGVFALAPYMGLPLAAVAVALGAIVVAAVLLMTVSAKLKNDMRGRS